MRTVDQKIDDAVVEPNWDFEFNHFTQEDQAELIAEYYSTNPQICEDVVINSDEFECLLGCMIELNKIIPSLIAMSGIELKSESQYRVLKNFTRNMHDVLEPLSDNIQQDILDPMAYSDGFVDRQLIIDTKELMRGEL